MKRLQMIKTLLWMNKRCWWAVGLLTLAHLAHADDSQAVSFARQAGIVAGAAQGCGQPIGLMTSRTNEVIGVLAVDLADKSAATNAYNSAVQNSANSQTLSQQLTCPKVMKDFLNLPMMQSQAEFEDNVIKKLKLPPSSAVTTPATDTTNSVAQPVATNSPPSNSSATATSNPAAQTIQAAATNSPPPYHLPPTDASATTTTPANGPASVPLQQVVTSSSPATVPLDNSTAATTTANAPNVNTANLTDAQRVQMAQKLTDMAASLLSSTQPAQFSNSYSQNVTNQQLNGVGANNPAFSNSLGVQPYPAGQTSSAAIASGDPSLQPYPATSPAIPQSYPP